MKARATNEQLTKVLEYTLTEHHKNIEKSEKARLQFLKEYQEGIERIRGVKISPDLTAFKQLNEEFDRKCIDGSNRINEALKSFYFSPLVLGIVLTVFLSGIGLIIYSFKNLEKANATMEKAKWVEQKDTALFKKFLHDNPKAKESFKIWYEKEYK